MSLKMPLFFGWDLNRRELDHLRPLHFKDISEINRLIRGSIVLNIDLRNDVQRNQFITAQSKSWEAREDVADKKGFISEVVGESFTLTIPRKAVNGLSAVHRIEVHVTLLKSYEHMGSLSVRVTGTGGNNSGSGSSSVDKMLIQQVVTLDSLWKEHSSEQVLEKFMLNSTLFADPVTFHPVSTTTTTTTTTTATATATASGSNTEKVTSTTGGEKHKWNELEITFTVIPSEPVRSENKVKLVSVAVYFSD